MRILKQIVKSFLALISASFLLVACEPSVKIETVISESQQSLEIHRFDLDFKNSSAADIASLKDQYPFFFPRQTADSIWVAKIQDSIQQRLFEAVATRFPNFDSIGVELSHLYAHQSYYFKQPIIPQIYTLTNEVDHEFRVIATDSMWLVALDNYLGPEHDFYKTFPRYIKDQKDPAFLLVDMAASIATATVPPPRQPYFLSEMVYEGKKIWLQQLLWPHQTEATHLHYTEEEYDWAAENEAQIWRYFMENKLLYNTDKDLAYRFLYPAPFSKFNLEIDQDSPPQIGIFMGLQLVKSYYKNTGEDLQKLLNVNAVDLLKEAAYKPRK